MSKFTACILKTGGTTEKPIIPVISATLGFITSFIQNVGAAVLLLPAVSRISARSGIPFSRLLMPMDFIATLGCTMIRLFLVATMLMMNLVFWGAT